MADHVKRIRGTRTKNTQHKIVTAAAELFVTDGYHGTTLEQIAARAGVAVQTVYFHFGNKRSVLKRAVDVAAVGDDESVAMLDRPWLEEAAERAGPSSGDRAVDGLRPRHRDPERTDHAGRARRRGRRPGDG